MTFSLSPAYNLKAVLKETGIKPDVLRAWERRYGVPMPQRTAGGHRLYSEHDIEMIKWLIRRQNDGLSISRAVDMWTDQISQGHDPLMESQPKPGNPAPVAAMKVDSGQVMPPVLETGIDALRASWISACMNFNESSAEQTLNQAFALFPLNTVCMQVLQRGMAEIGSLWYENRASVHQEHFASALAMRRLNALMAAAPAPTREQTVIVGCPANEWHAFTTLLLALFIRRRGFNVIYLGANLPNAHIIETIEVVHADLVVLAAQQLSTAASLHESAAMIDIQGTPLAFGGRIFAMHSDLVTRIAGHYLGDNMEHAIDAVETLLTIRPSAQRPRLPSREHLAALDAFYAKRVFIEASLNEEARARGSFSDYFGIAHKFMGDNIQAALKLGDMAYIDSEIDWLNIMLESQNLHRSVVAQYLEMYSRCVSRHLGGQAAPIIGWFEKHLNSRIK